MIEGWHDDDYLILFDDTDVEDLTARYGLAAYLAGYQIIGLCGWDDFIIRDLNGGLFSVPTVPMDRRYLRPLAFSIDRAKIVPDERFSGKIKWYVQPVVFGGSPTAEDNISWVDLPQHIEYVKWWNQKYREVSGDKPK